MLVPVRSTRATRALDHDFLERVVERAGFWPFTAGALLRAA